MQMTNEEILRSFKTAKDPHGQVRRLAELNACDEQKIKDVLMAQGVDVRNFPKKRGRTPKQTGETPQRKGNSAATPSIVQAVEREMEGLLARRREIEELTGHMRDEQTRIDVKMKALKAALPLLEDAYMEQMKDLETED